MDGGQEVYEIPQGSKPGTFIRGNVYKFTKCDVSCVPAAVDLADLLRVCTKCTKIPPPTSYSCKSGHVTCFECAPSDLSCPFEKCWLPLTIFRCHALTTLIWESTVACPGKDCSEEVKGSELFSHEANCNGVTSLPCFISMCHHGKQYTKVSLLQHLIEEHGIPLHTQSNGILTHVLHDEISFRSFGDWTVAFLLEYDNTQFICIVGREVVEDKPSLIIILYHIPTGYSKDAVRYQATIVLVSNYGFERSYTGMLPNIASFQDDVIKCFRCLIVPDEIIPPSSRCIQIQVKKRRLKND